MNGTLVEQPAPAVVEKAEERVGTQRASGPQKLDARWAKVFCIGWPAAAVLMTLIEPVSNTEPSALITLIGTAMFFGLAFTFGGTVVQAAQRRPSAANWASGAALLSVVATVTCPMSGHHQAVGSWWYVQMGLSLGMLVASRVAAVRGSTAA